MYKADTLPSLDPRLTFVRPSFDPHLTLICLTPHPGYLINVYKADVPQLDRIARVRPSFDPHFFTPQPGYAINVYKVDAPQLRRWLYGPAPAETARNDIAFLRLSLR